MVFDQSAFVKIAVKNVINEGTIGLVLTALMILLFLGNVRATIAVLISIPVSVLATFLGLNLGGSPINTMVLGGLALALSRLIDNSVVVLENIFRHMEMGESPAVAAELGGKEVQLAVLAATVSTSIVFFPVLMLYGVSKYLFTALALAVVIALFASYVVAMTVVPLFCSLFITIDPGTNFITLRQTTIQRRYRARKKEYACFSRRRQVQSCLPTARNMVREKSRSRFRTRRDDRS